MGNVKGKREKKARTSKKERKGDSINKEPHHQCKESERSVPLISLRA